MKHTICYFLFFIYLIDSGADFPQKRQKTQKFDYKSEGVTEEYTFIGDLLIHKSKYRFYNCFKKIKTANSYRGQSSILFLSTRDTLVYLLDNKTDFPDSLSNNLFYLGGNALHVNELDGIICLHHGCIELQRYGQSILKSIKRLK